MVTYAHKTLLVTVYEKQPGKPELLLTKSIPDGDEVDLLDVEFLKDIGVNSHLFFESDFGTEIVTSERYNIFYDENMLSELDGAKMSPLAGRCKVPPAGLSVVWEG